MNVLGFKTNNLKKTNFWSKGELQQTGFFLIACVLKNVKSYRFFCQILVDVQKAL